mgnify:CR=1 FL=1
MIFQSTFWDSIANDCQQIIDQIPKKDFKLSLLKIQAKSTDNQKTLINDAFEEWLRDNEQVDDACIIGLKI